MPAGRRASQNIRPEALDPIAGSRARRPRPGASNQPVAPAVDLDATHTDRTMRSLPSAAAYAAALLAAGAIAAPAFAPTPHATGVAGYLPGPGVSPGFDDPTLALGGPQGCGVLCGSLDASRAGASSRTF